jgi:hypothetical protein
MLRPSLLLLLPLLFSWTPPPASATSSTDNDVHVVDVDDYDDDYNRTIYFTKPDEKCMTMVLRSELDVSRAN